MAIIAILCYHANMKGAIAICACCLGLTLLFCASAAADDKKNILVLNSYHQGYKWTDDEIRGILAGIGAWQDRSRVYIEYMGTKWASDRQYFEKLTTIYRHKFSAITFDIIFASDNDAFDFLRRYRNEVFGRVPVVFCGVNWVRPEDLSGASLFTGVNEDADISATLDLMLRLHPRTKTIYFVIDATTTGRIMHGKIMELAPRYREQVQFHLLEHLPMEEILTTTARAPDDSLVLLTVFQKDAAGVFFEFSESTRLLSTNSRVPVYGLWDFNLGYGIVGGMLTSGFDQGREAGDLGRRILSGEKVESLPVNMESPHRYMFDYDQLVRFKLIRTSLPDGSTIINEPLSFYTVNKALFWSILGGMLFLGIVVVVLLVNIRQRRRAQAELRKAHDDLEVRVRERTADLVRVNDLLRAEITERTRAENEIRGLNAELGEFNQELETLISERTMNLMALSVADKVRNPAALIGAVSNRLLEKEPPEEQLPRKLREQLEIVQESALSLERIVTDFQGMLREKRSMFTHADLNQIVQGVVPIILREAETRGIELSVSYADQALMINTQPSLLRMAVFHITRNALEATPRGGSVRITTAHAPDRIILLVQDSGKGIPQQEIGKIFDPFFSTKERHFGMGLPLVKQVMSEHLGEVLVESGPGGGTTFRLIFPVRWKEKQGTAS